MKIVVLDGATLNPGDLDWAPLAALGECVFYERTPVEKVVERSRGAGALLTNKVTLSRAEIAALPDLGYIGVTATGYNIVDVQAAREHGVTVTNAPGYGAESVAQATFALLLELANHAGHHAATVAGGRWSDSPDFCYWDFPLVELGGLTMGIVGLGEIGSAVARIARGFRMKVVSHTRTPRETEGVTFVELDRLFAESDVISLHCPLSAETERMVDARRLSLVKPTAFLVNTARGGLVDEAALAKALNSGRIAGAGLDVLSTEPPSPSNPLLSAANCLVTPHIAWASRAARDRLLGTVVANLKAFAEGSSVNVVS